MIEDAFWVTASADGPFDDDFMALTEGQQHLAVLTLIWAEIMSGGATAPLYVSGGNFLPEAIVAARALGAEMTIRLLASIVDLVGVSAPELRDLHLRVEALDRSGSDTGQHAANLALLVEPASEWFSSAERFIGSNRGDFFV